MKFIQYQFIKISLIFLNPPISNSSNCITILLWQRNLIHPIASIVKLQLINSHFSLLYVNWPHHECEIRGEKMKARSECDVNYDSVLHTHQRVYDLIQTDKIVCAACHHVLCAVPFLAVSFISHHENLSTGEEKKC